MTVERRLRHHFDAARSDLTEPQPNLQRVVQRGRRRRNVQTGAMAAGTLSLAVVAVLGVQGLTRSRVEFAPASPRPPAAPSETSPEASASPSPSASPSAGDGIETVDVRDLGGSVMTYETWPNFGGVMQFDYETGTSGSSVGSVIAAFPDGRDGFVGQVDPHKVIWHPGSAPEVRLRNVADPDNPESSVMLRGVEPDGTVIFSTRPEKRDAEDTVERFFAVALDPGAEPKLLAEEFAYEAGYAGPATAADVRVIASCHLMCSLWRWPGEDAKPLYDGQTSIEGLTSTPDGSLVSFVESDVTRAENATVKLVVLDGSTFEPRLRLALPVANGTPITAAVVSVSSDGQRILVAVDAPPRTKVPVPRTTFLVDDALSAAPVVRKVDFRGVVQWLDPAAVQKK